MQERFKVNVRRSCRLALLRPSVWYQRSEARDQSALPLAHPGDRDGSSTIRVPARAGHASGARVGLLARSASMDCTGWKDCSCV